MASIFTRIIKREIPAHIVAENDDFIAFLDINPLQKGHTLVVPKKETDYLFDLDDNTLEKLLLFARPIAKGIEKSLPCTRIGVTVIGLEVPHAHVHLIPISGIADMDFSRPKLKIAADEMSQIADRINANIEG